ncbi:MAG: signal peptidase I [Armatimonadetes bacterium]|nr:signal peptidase I [Armatimonadota bacterium]
MVQEHEIVISPTTAETPAPSRETKAGHRGAFGRAAVEAALLALLLLFLLIRPFILEPFYIPSNSMVPALKDGDRILASKLSFRWGEPRRGEVVVFYGAEDSGHAEEIFVKRIIGLPGEHVYISEGKVFIQGMPLDEEYLHGIPYGNYGPYRVPEGTYFMLGDNRNDSRDSRFWGSIPRENLIGRAACVFWPLKRAHQIR